METVQSIKQRFSIIGNDTGLNRAIEKAVQVAPTDISVLVTGESGVGKESIPKIIHQLSHRKHGKYIAVNCGAIPEGTIDSELFGHEKGAFTGATQSRSGYFEVANGGTIFLDEVGELPLTTQVRLLRVLENGEFIKVGSSTVLKTDVRIVAATNVNMFEAIEKEKFREDLYYRLSTIEILLPALRERKDDIHLLFRKFASDFALKYKMPTIRLDDNAVQALINYRWSGNVRQLRNVAEQISVLESSRLIDAVTLKTYLPNMEGNFPTVQQKDKSQSDFSTEREILYKVLFDMKSDLNDLKKLTMELMQNDNHSDVQKNNESLIQKIYKKEEVLESEKEPEFLSLPAKPQNENAVEIVKDTEEKYTYIDAIEEEEEEETLSLHDKELELIKKSLERHKGKRKLAADELGISERTLYRKIKQYDL
jgi:transcriptional regulator with PAS, ATPase and Fis domain